MKKKFFCKIIFGVLVVIFFISIVWFIFREPGEMGTVMKINSQKVVKEEYQMIINSYQAKVKSKYSTEQVNQKKFWTTEFNGETPISEIMELAEKELVEKKILAEIANENNIRIYTDYKTLKDNMTKENDIRKDKEQGGEVIYGLSSYTIDNFYQYTYYNLETAVKESLKKEYEISEESLKSIYEKNKSLYNYDIGVKVLICEFSEMDEKENDIRNYMKGEQNIDTLKIKFPEVNFYELEMNSLDTKGGKSGAYDLRWEIASKLNVGEVCAPFKIGNNTLVMKCIERVDNGYQSFDEIKGVLKSQLQDLSASKYIDDKIDSANVKFKSSILENVALEILN